MRLTDIAGTRFETNIIGSMVTVFTATRPLKGLSWCFVAETRYSPNSREIRLLHVSQSSATTKIHRGLNHRLEMNTYLVRARLVLARSVVLLDTDDLLRRWLSMDLSYTESS